MGRGGEGWEIKAARSKHNGAVEGGGRRSIVTCKYGRLRIIHALINTDGGRFGIQSLLGRREKSVEQEVAIIRIVGAKLYARHLPGGCLKVEVSSYRSVLNRNSPPK